MQKKTSTSGRPFIRAVSCGAAVVCAATLALALAVDSSAVAEKEDAPLARASRARCGGSSPSGAAASGRVIPQFPMAAQIDFVQPGGNAVEPAAIQLCQHRSPVFCGVDCQACGDGCGELRWAASQPIPWEVFAHGEYVGPARSAHVPVYHLRVDDQLEFIYRFTHEESGVAYRLGIGDEIIIESFTDPTLNRGDLNLGQGLAIQPDGTVTLPLLGQVPVARRTVEEVRRDLETRYREFNREPTIWVTPLKTNTKLEDLRATVDGRFGQGGQRLQGQVTPEGTVQLPAIGSVAAQGLTLGELEREIEERYLHEVGAGVEVTPRLVQRAPRFIYVVGEVAQSGQYPLQQPTTVMGAIALAGGWNVGGNLREIVVFRRAEDWRLMATRIDIRGALLGKRPCPADEIWLRDSDILVVPKTPMLLMDDWINLVFTRGLYGVFPVGVAINLSKLSTI